VKTLSLIIAAAALTLAGCSPAKQDSGVPATDTASASGGPGQSMAIKRYSMHGKVLAVDAAAKSAKIDAGPIGDWMGAMTMEYPFKDAAEVAKLTAGATIDATVFVEGDNFWVGEVKLPAATASTGK
jgi:Cu/Ag efflux protein CusF